MSHWEWEIFEKEYADMNWYKGKQVKHVKGMEMGENGRNLVSIHSPPSGLSSF
jgi:5'-3' exoribonuclease 1